MNSIRRNNTRPAPSPATERHAMPNESAQTASGRQHGQVSNAEIARLCAEASRLVFTDFEAARFRLDQVRETIIPETPHAIRLEFYRSAAFLENQLHRYARAIHYLDQAIEILEPLAAPLPLADAWLDMAAIWTNLRDWEKAESTLGRAKKLLADSQDVRLKARFDTREGFFQMQIGQDKTALSLFMEAERLFLSLDNDMEIKDFYILTLALSGLGEIYKRFDEREKSVAAFRQVLRICEENHLRPRLAWHYLNGGNACLALNDTAGASEYFQNALRYADEGDVALKSSAYANLGISAYLEGDTDRARRLLNAGSGLFADPDSPEVFKNLAIMELWKGRILAENGQENQAEAHFQAALKHSEKSTDLHLSAEVCGMMAQFRAGQQRFDEAFEFQKKATDFADRYARQIHDKEIRELEARHELEKQRHQTRVAQLRLTGLQLRALRAQMNPHFLFNSLNAIQGLITSGRSLEAEKFLSRFSKLMRRTLDYTDLEVIPLENEIEFLRDYLDLNRQLRFSDNFACLFYVSPELEAEDIYIPTMIIQPFVENAIEHGLRPMQGGTLRIRFELDEEDENLLHCTIEDDGMGFDKSREQKQRSGEAAFRTHKSRGMEITSERLALLHKQQGRELEKQVKIQDLGAISGGKQRGTRVEVLMPILEPED